MHKGCYVINFEPFVLGLHCLHQNKYVGVAETAVNQLIKIFEKYLFS